jgi:glycosyltransferase involved in cell wall biosynthesis
MPELIKDRVSVIVPCYNVSEYIPAAIECLTGQTYQDVEVILVDDGSTDSDTWALCQEASEKYPNFYARHKQNGGLSSARNYGYQHATGEFIYYYDPDDTIERDLISLSVQAAKEYGADYVVFGYYMALEAPSGSSIEVKYGVKDAAVYRSHEEVIENLLHLTDKSLIYNAWNKLFRREILDQHDILFQPVESGEDWMYNLQYIEKCKSMAVLSECPYRYVRERQGNLSTAYRSNWFDLRLQEHLRYTEMYKQIGCWSQSVQLYFARRHAERVLGCIENELSQFNPSSAKEKRKHIKEMITEGYTTEAFKMMQPTSKKIMIMAIPVKMGSVFLTYQLGKALAFVKTRYPKLFFKLKADR